KVRKKETIRKLEDTDADLARVDDLLFEIDKNMKSLERQAKQAKNYYKTKEEYKDLSVKLARKTVSRQNEQFIAIGRQIEKENDEKTAVIAKIREKEVEIEKA